MLKKGRQLRGTAQRKMMSESLKRMRKRKGTKHLTRAIRDHLKEQRRSTTIMSAGKSFQKKHGLFEQGLRQ